MGDERTGLRSDELRAASGEALAGRLERLGDLLARHGGLPGSRPNLALAAALGEELSKAGNNARPLLAALAADPARPDEARAFLPIAAAFAYVARIERDEGAAWHGIFELCADDRPPVRIGLCAALVAWATRRRGNLDRLVERGAGWLEEEDRDHRYAACAIVLDVVASGIEGLEDATALLAFVERAIAESADAPRAAERSPARRRLLGALPLAISRIASSLRGSIDGIAWLGERLVEARHPDVRMAMQSAIELLRRGAGAQTSATIDSLRAALASSAKPPRDPSRIREGTGRGKRGRSRH